MKSMSRLHLHPHAAPNGTAYIVADRRGLRDLAKKLAQAADSAVGIDSITFHSSDGHEYKLLIVSDVSEEEWQAMPLPTHQHSDPSQLAIVKTYKSMQPTPTQ